MKRCRALGLTVVLSLQSWASPPVSSPPEGLFAGGSPVSFVGAAACAGCSTERYTLNLWNDGLFYLRREEPETGEREDDVGQWLASAETGAISLFGSAPAALNYAILAPGLLEARDSDPRSDDEPLHLRLERAADFVSFEPRLTVRGMYSYMADAALFRECQSNRRFEVAPEGDNAAVEAAYLALRREPAEELLLEMDARFVRRAPMEGQGLREAVVPERLAGFWPGESCGQRFAQAELENSYWKLTRLRGDPVVVPQDLREPHLRLTGREARAEGFGGCNRFFASYLLDGERIEFSALGSTRKACPPDWSMEPVFFDVLAEVRRWRIVRDHLDLLDDPGNVVARFEARLLD